MRMHTHGKHLRNIRQSATTTTAMRAKHHLPVPHLMPLAIVLLLSALAIEPGLADLRPKHSPGRRDVCILGGGASGSAAAVRLADMGLDVVVIETFGSLGGHCDTQLGPNGTWVEPGVAIYPKTALANSIGCGPWNFDFEAYVRRFAGPDAVRPWSFFEGITPYGSDFSSGLFLGPLPPPPDPTPEFTAAYERFVAMMATEYAWMDNLLSVPNPIPHELTLSLNEFLALKNLTVILPSFFGPLYYAGFGDFDSLTAFDGLMQRTCTNLLYDYYPGSWFSVGPGGCQALYDGIQSFLGPDHVRTRATVDMVQRPRNPRSSAPVIVTGTQVGPDGLTSRRFIERCDSLIVAFAPLVDRLEPFMDLTAAERHILEPLEARSLFAGSFQVSGGALGSSNFTLANLNLSSPLALPSFPCATTIYRRFAEGPVAIQVFASSPIPLATARTIANDTISRLIANGVFAQASGLSVWPHTYNPHWPRADLRKPYAPHNFFDDIQGIRDTYYVGAARTTANTMTVISYANQLVDEFFA